MDKVILVVRCVIKYGGAFLLIKQKNKSNKEYFLFPGGHVEEGENLQSALKRELYEELGIEVLPQKILFTRETDSPFDKCLEIFFMCKTKSKKSSIKTFQKGVVGQEELISVNFFQKNELIHLKSFVPGPQFFSSDYEYRNLDTNEYVSIFGKDKNFKNEL